MSRITISFRIYKNASKTNQNLRVCAKLSGSSQYHPRAIVSFGKGDLTDPDYVKFNSKKQRFENRSRNASVNNALLDKIEEFCNAILEENSPTTIEDFWELIEQSKEGKPVTKDDKTLEWFLKEIIAEYRDGYANKLPSANFQTYVRLLHHLEREDSRPRSKHLLRVPIGQISDKEFQQFGDYLRPLKGPNYLDLMKYFKRAHNIAIRKHLASTPLTYRYMDDTPVKTFEELSALNKGVASLSANQIQRIEKLDLAKIVLKCKNNAFYKRLYLDTCLLMFYLYSRPIDILNMKHSNIRKCEKGFYIEYLPIKKKNSANALKSFVRCPICDKAMAIIKKYEGMSEAGYILPFSDNNREWDLSDPEQYHKRYNRCNAMLGYVNTFLKKIAAHLKITFFNDTLTTYVFRHSAISIAITDKNIPPLVVAKMAGTSLKEIERSYMDHTVNMFEYV